MDDTLSVKKQLDNFYIQQNIVTGDEIIPPKNEENSKIIVERLIADVSKQIIHVLFRIYWDFIDPDSYVAGLKAKAYADYVVHVLIGVLEKKSELKEKTFSHFLKKLKYEVKSQNLKEDLITRDAFESLVIKHGILRWDIVAAPEFSELKKAYEDGSWLDEEEKTITTMHIDEMMVGFFHVFGGVIDQMFSDRYIRSDIQSILSTEDPFPIDNNDMSTHIAKACEDNIKSILKKKEPQTDTDDTQISDEADIY